MKGLNINIGVRQHKIITLETVNLMKIVLTSISNERVSSRDVSQTTMVYTFNNDI